MTDTIQLPIWLVVILAVAAMASIYRHLISPFIGAYLSTREKSLNQRLKTDLARPLPEVLRIGRSTRVELFINSPEVQEAINLAVKDNQGTRELLEFKVSEFAKELTPGFYSLFYFKIGYAIARAYIRLLYDVNIAQQPPLEIADIPENSSVVLVGNHRSNLDVMMLAYLSSRTSMVSFAAGEWGKTWPMSTLLHLSGSYIIRRNEPLPLYRKILAIHLRNLVKAKMPQGIFLEGGLTRDGSIQPVKLGLLSYLLSALDENNVNDVVFVPVAFNYGQIPEDKTLLQRQEQGFAGRSRFMTLMSTLGSLSKVIYRRIRRGKTAYGRAAVSFGAPISMHAWLSSKPFERPLNAEQKREIVTPVADDIITTIKEMIPVLPISIVVAVFKNSAQAVLSDNELTNRCKTLIDDLERKNVVLALDKDSADTEIESGLQLLISRRVIYKVRDGYEINNEALPLLNYLYNSISHLL